MEVPVRLSVGTSDPISTKSFVQICVFNIRKALMILMVPFWMETTLSIS